MPTRILVIEDPAAPWDNFSLILTQMCGMTNAQIDHARWYTEAKEMIEMEQYDVILLDHRMPYDDPRCTDETNFRKFSAQLRNIGYGLLPLIETRQKRTVVIGTASLNPDEMGPYTAPELRLDKTNMFDELPPLLERI